MARAEQARGIWRADVEQLTVVEILTRTSSEFFSNTEVWHVRSSCVGDILRVCISSPDTPLPRGARIGAVYATDAPWFAGSLVNTLRSCELGSELPPLFAISIGYAIDRETPHLIQRTRDLTPTPHPSFDRVFPAMADCPQIVASGGSAAFLSFLLDELCTAIEREFPIDPAEATLAGSSLGGLFALTTLLERGEAFRRYLAISPAIWWDNRALIRSAAARDISCAVPRASVYMCAGEFEGRDHLKAHFAAMSTNIVRKLPPDMLNADVHGDMYELAHIFSTWRGDEFRFCARTYPEESHTSIGGAALSRGLRTLYGSLPW